MLVEKLETQSKTFKGLIAQWLENALVAFPSVKRQSLYNVDDIGILFRPCLFCMGVSINPQRSLCDYYDLGIGIELMQMSTLVIDDILDNSPMRNGRDSMPNKFGIKNTILIGELFKNMTNEIVLSHTLLTLEEKCRIIQNIENAYHRICIGQFLDLQYENHNIISEKKYFEMIELTTGYFIQTSLLIGAIIANVNSDDYNALANYGLKIGTAYQLRDDLVNIFANGVNGKVVAEDLIAKKKRLPAIVALINPATSKDFQKIWNKQHFSDTDITNMINIIENSSVIDYCVAKLKKLTKDAIDSIKLNNFNMKQDLIELANLVSSI